MRRLVYPLMGSLALTACSAETPDDDTTPGTEAPESTGTPVPESASPTPVDEPQGDGYYAPLPDPTTALAAAVLHDKLYTYGGTTESAHIENNEVFISEIRRLDLNDPDAEWETIAGPDMPIQQAGLFVYKERLYRLGGLIALNPPEEDADLWSVADFAVYDEATDTWTSLPDMPDTRSSNSIGIHDGVLYVMGGWKMEGGSDSWTYYDTWLSIDLEADPMVWEEHEQPFQVRDHCGGVKDGKVYLIGGMLSGYFPSEPYVYDIASGEWSTGPELPIDHPYKGFGCASAVVDGELYFSGIDGVVYRLKDDHGGWEAVDYLNPARSFHAMPARGSGELIAVGGGTGNEIDAIDLVESILLDGR